MNLYFWIERYLFFPNFIQRILSITLLPLTIIYCIIILSKRFFAKKIELGIPIISIGNLIVGGSGKTPITIALAKDRDEIAIVLRGYKRESKGVVVVSNRGEILTDVISSGDEAMLLATSLDKAIVIVAEDRVAGITKAKELGAKTIFLDDGFSKSYIKKLDILVKPKKQPTNIFCLPSGGYREPRFLYSSADLVIDESTDMTKQTHISNPSENMVLVTAISKPQRLDEYLPHDMPKYYFADHHSFSLDELQEIIIKHKCTSLLVTTKDYVKIKDLDIECSILELDILLDTKIIKKVDNYIKNYNK
jgi:tetraacyldisaccharide 4'-kinase